MHEPLHRYLDLQLAAPSPGHAVLRHLLQTQPSLILEGLTDRALPEGLRWLSYRQVQRLREKGVVPLHDVVWSTPHGPATLLRLGPRWILGRTPGAAWVTTQL